jgi:thiol-disulfide isomerase/thioredoxin
VARDRRVIGVRATSYSDGRRAQARSATPHRKTPAMLRSIVTALFVLAPAAALSHASRTAQAPQQEATLKPGDPAPALAIEKWIKGKPVEKFEPGHVYVVEFWATWCTPCIASMPHISKLQKDYAGRATIIGTNIWERPYDDKTLATIEEFVANQSDRMAYTVAYDGPGKVTDKAYMAAAGRSGIPSAFIVDQQGRIAWMGHPAAMDFALHEIVEGKWDLATGPEREKQIYERLKAVRTMLKPDPAGAQTEFDKFAKEFPYIAKHQDDLKLELLKVAGKWDEVYVVWNQRYETALKHKDANALNAIAWGIVDPTLTIERRDLDLALRAAQSAVEFSHSKSAAMLDTLARVHATKGDYAKAIEIQTLAVETASDRARSPLQQALDAYKAKAAQ